MVNRHPLSDTDIANTAAAFVATTAAGLGYTFEQVFPFARHLAVPERTSSNENLVWLNRWLTGFSNEMNENAQQGIDVRKAVFEKHLKIFYEKIVDLK